MSGRDFRKVVFFLGLPCLQDYYHAAQLRPLICLCSPTYTAAWKDIEGTTIKGIPITALLGDDKLQREQKIPEDSVTGSFLKSPPPPLHPSYKSE